MEESKFKDIVCNVIVSWVETEHKELLRHPPRFGKVKKDPRGCLYQPAIINDEYVIYSSLKEDAITVDIHKFDGINSTTPVECFAVIFPESIL